MRLPLLETQRRVPCHQLEEYALAFDLLDFILHHGRRFWRDTPEKDSDLSALRSQPRYSQLATR
ncbi:MAG TPA: hypothetical protein VGF73_03405 [Chthoniobacterales bacterium]